MLVVYTLNIYRLPFFAVCCNTLQYVAACYERDSEKRDKITRARSSARET